MSEVESRRDPDERFEASLRLAVQMHALSGLYQGVVHDLKSPLNALVVNLELLRASLSQDHPKSDKQLRYARVLQEELMRLNRSIESLLPAAAPAASEPSRFDLGELVDEVVAFVAPQARQQRVTISRPGSAAAEPESEDRESPGGPRLAVTCHRDRVKQALLAVAVNALEAMPDGGALGVETAADGRRARVRITDTGPGLPEKTKDRLDELYFSTKEGHLGLGLYVTHQVVKSAEGSIEMISDAGAGTRVDLFIPLS
jgi:signal transduction histidine kinase